MSHKSTKMHHENPDRERLVWEGGRGPVLVEDMDIGHLTNAIAFAEREGFQSEALPAMKARLAELSR